MAEAKKKTETKTATKKKADVKVESVVDKEVIADKPADKPVVKGDYWGGAISPDNHTIVLLDRDGRAAQRRFAVAEARSAWILFLDADEEATPPVEAEVRAVLSAPRFDGYRIPRRGLFLGTWIRHGAWGRDRVLRLARRSAARVADRRVHEAMEVDGPVGDLSAPLLHHSQPDLASVGRKFGRYVELAAQDLADRRRGRGVAAWETALRPAGDFVRDYVLRLGFLDGTAGLLLASVGALSTMAKYHRARRILDGLNGLAGR